MVTVCTWVGGGIGAAIGFGQSMSAFKDMPGGPGAGGMGGAMFSALGLGFLGGIVGAVVGLIVQKLVVTLSPPASTSLPRVTDVPDAPVETVTPAPAPYTPPESSPAEGDSGDSTT